MVGGADADRRAGGSLTDALGLRRTFLLAFTLCILSRVFLTFATIKWSALGGGMVLLAAGEGMLAPVKVAALRRCCPASGPRHSGTLWLIIGLSTMVAPVGLFVFQRYIRVHEAGRDD